MLLGKRSHLFIMEKVLFAAIQTETSQNDCFRAFPLNHRGSKEQLSKMMPSGRLLVALAVPRCDRDPPQPLFGPAATGASLPSAAGLLLLALLGERGQDVGTPGDLGLGLSSGAVPGFGAAGHSGSSHREGRVRDRQHLTRAVRSFSLPAGCPSPFPWFKRASKGHGKRSLCPAAHVLE